MGKVVVFNNVTLDGVMQAPARTDEDTRGGFPYGGWGIPYGDEVSAKVTGQSMAHSGALLLGRRTYEDFYAVWPQRKESPFSEILNQAQKYVVSNLLKEPLPWMNSTLIKGDLVAAINKLKAQESKDLVILGSGVLVQAMMKQNLIDQFVLFIVPLILGTGRHLFPDGSAFSKLKLVSSTPTTKGVIITTYEPVEGMTNDG